MKLSFLIDSYSAIYTHYKHKVSFGQYGYYSWANDLTGTNHMIVSYNFTLTTVRNFRY